MTEQNHKNIPSEARSKYEITFEDFQIGDKVKVVSGPLKAVIDKAEAIISNDKGPNGTLAIKVDGELYLVDEDDIELNNLMEMNYVETTSGVNVVVSNQEQEVIDKGNRLKRDDLDEWEQNIMDQLVSKNIYKRQKTSDGMRYIRNNIEMERF